MRRYVFGLALTPLAVLGACALQPAYQRPSLPTAAAWSNAPPSPAATVTVDRDGWWTLLGDPVVDALVTAGLRDNPTLAEAAARADQARAALGGADAAGRPGLTGNASAQRARDRAGAGEATTTQNSATLGASLAWELDLWGRVGQSAKAAQNRLTARNADAEAARLSIIGDIADTVLALRVCELTLEIRDRDIGSRETEMKITRARLASGSIAPVAVATASSNLASARTDRIAQQEACHRLANALTALSGVEPGAIWQLLSQSAVARAAPIPAPPPFSPALPATVLLGHPAVIAAEREAAARWSEIAVTRAERLPRVDLAATLSGQWVRALGSTTSYGARSAGVSLTGPLFDGGAGAARIDGAQASYREAVARLDLSIKAAVRDIEDALAAEQSAIARIDTSREAFAAASFTLEANAARWRAGSIAQVELEESRRQFNRAQESVIVAAADHARAWVALIRTTGAPQSAQQTQQGAPRAAMTPTPTASAAP